MLRRPRRRCPSTRRAPPKVERGTPCPERRPKAERFEPFLRVHPADFTVSPGGDCDPIPLFGRPARSAMGASAETRRACSRARSRRARIDQSRPFEIIHRRRRAERKSRRARLDLGAPVAARDEADGTWSWHHVPGPHSPSSRQAGGATHQDSRVRTRREKGESAAPGQRHWLHDRAAGRAANQKSPPGPATSNERRLPPDATTIQRTVAGGRFRARARDQAAITGRPSARPLPASARRRGDEVHGRDHIDEGRVGVPGAIMVDRP